MFAFQPSSPWSRREAVHTTQHEVQGSGIDMPDSRAGFPTGFHRGSPLLYGVALVVAGLGACASVPPPPTPEMTRAESAIEQAQRAGAGEFATESLAAAQHKLDEAKTAVTQRDNARARQLVEESYADARLADLTAQSAKSTRAAAEVDKTIRTLEDETTRVRSP